MVYYTDRAKYGGIRDAQARLDRRVPWGHVANAAVLEQPQSALEVCKIAELDKQHIFKTPVYIKTSGGMTVVDNQFAIGRRDTREVFQVASGQYTIKQNLEAAKELDKLVGGRRIFVGGGSLGSGRKVYYVADMGTEFEVAQGDVVKNQLIFTNYHDGGGALTVAVVPFRLSCLNQLNSAMRGAQARFKMVHRASIGQFVARAQEYFDEQEEYFQVFGKACKELAATRLSDDDLGVFAMQLLEIDPGTKAEEWSGGQRRSFEELAPLLARPTGFENGHSAWAAYNAATEWVDHVRNPRARVGVRDEKRFETAIYGRGADIKQRAWELLTV